MKFRRQFEFSAEKLSENAKTINSVIVLEIKAKSSFGTCWQARGDSTGQGLRWEKQVALYISGQQQWLCSDQKASGGGAHTAILCLVFVFNINTSDLLYFDIMLLKTPDLCNLRTFVAIFFLSRFTHIFRQFLEAKKQTPPIYPLLECMAPLCHKYQNKLK